MSFNNYYFVLLFLPLTILGYFILNAFNKEKIANLYLLIVSLFFYGFNNVKALVIFIGYILINYFLYTCRHKKHLVVVSIVVNILFLVFYKYINVFENIFVLFKSYNIVMPLGISFYTFSQIAFIIDTYKEDYECKFVEYALFMSYFPKIIQGPISNGINFINQLREKDRRKINYDNLYNGFLLFIYGLIKKVLLADTLASAANWGYENIECLNTINTLIVILSYTLQIYLDFSGYSDMAIGISKMLNIDLPRNFGTPYGSKNISEFWKKWHMSLTNFLTKYIYIPLGGSRNGTIRTYINTIIVFAVSGIWHGNQINYLIWGLINGFALIFYKKYKDKINKLNPIVNWIITFCFINLSWIIFRSNSISVLCQLIKSLFDYQGLTINSDLITCFNFTELDFIPESLEFIRLFKTSRFYVILYLIIGFVISLKDGQFEDAIKDGRLKGINKCILVILFIYCLLSFTSNSTFVYEGF